MRLCRDPMFASLCWPTNRGKRGVMFDPFLSPRNIICFGTRQVVFSVTRNIFRNAKQLARKGVESSSEVVAFYRAPHVSRPDFNRRRVSDTLRSKMGALEGTITSYGQKKSRLSKVAPTNRDIMFGFSDEKHTGFLTVITRYDEHSMACSITNRGRDTPLSSYNKTKELAATRAFSHAQFHRNSVKYYHALTDVKTHFLARNAPAKCHNKICNATTLLLQR